MDKLLIGVVVITAVALAACNDRRNDNAAVSTTVPESSETIITYTAEPAPLAASESSSSMAATSVGSDSMSNEQMNVSLMDVETATSSRYRCESGRTIEVVQLTDDRVVVNYDGTPHEMESAVSASGARYVGDGHVWWGKGSGTGSEMTLFSALPDGSTGDEIEVCTQL